METIMKIPEKPGALPPITNAPPEQRRHRVPQAAGRLLLLLLVGTLLGAAAFAALGARTGGAQTPTLLLSPPAAPVAQGATFAVEVRVTNAANLAGLEFDIAYDPALLEVIDFSVAPGYASAAAACNPAAARCATLLGPVALPGSFGAGLVTYGAPPAPSGTVLVGALRVLALAPAGAAALTAGNVLLTNPSAVSVVASGSGAQITLAPAPTAVPTTVPPAVPTAAPTATATPPGPQPDSTVRVYLPIVDGQGEE